MIVLDASATLDRLLRTPAGLKIEQRIYVGSPNVHGPHLLDLEVTQALRRLVREGTISALRAESAISDQIDARLPGIRIGCF
jgi:predicted nucleic acid-binding protein